MLQDWGGRVKILRLSMSFLWQPNDHVSYETTYKKMNRAIPGLYPINNEASLYINMTKENKKYFKTTWRGIISLGIFFHKVTKFIIQQNS